MSSAILSEDVDMKELIGLLRRRDVVRLALVPRLACDPIRPPARTISIHLKKTKIPRKKKL
jgi:hypothetical protein